MEISPYYLSLLLLHSFLFGAFLGILNDVNRIVRVFFGVSYSQKSFRSLYARDLPLIHRPLVRQSSGKIKRGVLGVLIFFQDLFLMTAGGVGVVLLQYEYNSGRPRFFCLPALILGFLIYYFTIGRIVMLLSEGIVFVIRATGLVLGSCILYPFVKIFHFFVKKLIKNYKKIQYLIAKITKKLYNKHKKQEWLHMTEKGFFLLSDNRRRLRE